MKRLRVIVGFSVALGVAGSVRADLSAARWSMTSSPSPAVIGQGHLPAQTPSWVRDLDDASWLRLYPYGSSPVGEIPADPGREEAGARVGGQLPPAPGSASLFLCALGTLGAWHLSRSAMKLHIGAAPEWFHTGGRGQVGHAVSIDLDFAALPLSRFDQPVGERPVRIHFRRERSALGESQWYLSVAAPRGPPVLA